MSLRLDDRQAGGPAGQTYGVTSASQSSLRTSIARAAARAMLVLVSVSTGPVLAYANGGALPLTDPSLISHIKVTINKSQTIRFTKPFAEALVASAEYADVTPLTDHALYVIGKKIGQTRVTVLDREKHLLGVVDVEIGYDVPGLQKALREDGYLQAVRVTSANGRISLAGTVPDAPSQARALSIAEQFAPQFVSNSMMVRSSQQVLLEVRFVEVDRTSARDLGINWAAKTSGVVAATGIGGGVVDGIGLAGLPSGAAPFGLALIHLLNNADRVDLIIQALEQRGVARRLAEPNLVTLSGDTANFLAGGEFPYPVAQSGGTGTGSLLTGTISPTISIEFKKFGIGLGFTPTVLANGQINLKIEPEVSDIDPNQTFTYGGGITVPGLIIRRASATIELRDGQSFAMAGLLDDRHRTGQNQLPWIGQVPVLGTLFRSASYQKDETDLVIIVTPRLVKPAVPGERLATPLDQTVPGNDKDFFLLGRAELEKNYPAPYGHILDVGGSAWATTAHVEGGKAEADHGNIK